MLRKFVKEFIETHITDIEEHKWREVVSRWYDSALVHSLDYDEAMFEQFIYVMQHIVGVDFLQVTETARYDEIDFQLRSLIEGHLANPFAPSPRKYRKSVYTDQLVTTLGFSEQDVTKICDAAVSDFGLNYDENYYYIGED